LAKLFAYVRSHHPALVHVQETKLPWIEKKITSDWKKRDIHLVLTAHDLLHPEMQKKSAALQDLYANFDRIIVHAEENRQSLLKQFDLDEKAIRVIPHGEYASLASIQIEQMEARQALGIPPESKVILFFGYIRPYKGLKLLIEALASARKELPDLILLITGELKESFRSYENLIEEKKLKERVIKNLSYVPMEKTPLYFCAADVVALPYIHIYQSGVVQLAYAHKRAVIATTVGGLPEVIDDQKTGYLVPPNSPEKFAEAIFEAFSNMSRLKAMGEYAFQAAQQKYSWTQIAQATMDLYAELL
jgi:glycosyltransferase involved in cell wall biosynthesis